MEKNRIQMEDPEDLGLRAVMGNRFRDVRQQEKSSGQRQGKTAAPVAAALVWWAAVGVFGCWYRMGHMDAWAAMICMVTCGALGGFRLGRTGRG